MPKKIRMRLQNIDLRLVREDFKSYSQAKLQEMYKSAVFNGFQYGWKPKVMAKTVKYQIPEESGYLKVADSGSVV